MPLDPKLKGEMTGEPVEREPKVPEPQKQAADSAPVLPEPAPSASEEEPKQEAASPSSHAPEQDSAQQATMKRIERQIETLNENVTDLEEALNACQNPNFAPIFAKIEESQRTLEKLLANASHPAEKKTDAELDERLKKLEEMFQVFGEKQDKVDRQVVQTLRENASYQVQVRQGLQKDVETLRKQQSGEMYNGILKEIATMYSDYQMLLDDENLSPKSRKNMLSLFESMEDLLSDYDAEVVRCQPGDVRPTRQCKIINKIATGDQEMHNTIAQSRKPGVMRGKLVLCHEYVDVYVYDPSLKLEEPEIPEVPEETPQAEPAAAAPTAGEASAEREAIPENTEAQPTLDAEPTPDTEPIPKEETT